MITEHGFKDDIDNLKFQGDGDSCLKEDTGDAFRDDHQVAIFWMWYFNINC